MNSREDNPNRDEIRLSGSDLTLASAIRVACSFPGTRVSLTSESRDAVGRSRAYVEELLAGPDQIYGVTTGFGRLAEVVIPPDQREALQKNLVRSHCAGVGASLSREEVRIIMLLRANSLARGHSGIRVEVVERILDFLNLGIHPRVPEA
ncbi:MAG: aromatic amino acid lyase, partial [Longimicrobiales bacterium]